MPATPLPKGAHALLIALQTPSPDGQCGIPVLLWGKPGVGKSSFMTQLERPNFPVLTLLASIHDPTDFSGLPVLQDGEVHYARPAWMKVFEKAGEGVLFLDELTTAPPAVQAALLRVVLERRVGAHSLPEKVRVVAAANPPDQAYGNWELSPALRNRFVHLHWELPEAIYRASLIQGFAQGELPAIDPAIHSLKLPLWKYVIAAFLKRLPTALEGTPESSTFAFASPRSWNYLAQLLTSCDLLELTPRPRRKAAQACWELVEGCLGQRLGLTFSTYLKALQIQDVNKFIRAQSMDLSRLDDSALYILSQQIVDQLQAAENATDQERLGDVFLELLLVAQTTARFDGVEDSLKRAKFIGLWDTLMKRPQLQAKATAAAWQ